MCEVCASLFTHHQLKEAFSGVSIDTNPTSTGPCKPTLEILSSLIPRIIPQLPSSGPSNRLAVPHYPTPTTP